VTVDEIVVEFSCKGENLIGIATTGDLSGSVGVVVVVGGPQYRVGSHRQFVMLSRHLAARGIPAFRFDYRGMGDASGPMMSFEDVAQDLRCAIDAFMAACTSVKHVVLWGLCDGASASLMYCRSDSRVRGLVLLNPWVRDAQVQAVAQLKHYYWSRLFSGSFWLNLVSGRIRLFRTVSDLRAALAKALSGAKGDRVTQKQAFQSRMIDGWRDFSGESLVILSDNDLTAREFEEYASRRDEWRRRLNSAGVSRASVAGADHTFSTQALRTTVSELTADWIERELKPKLS
jgi:exosortase A-associated hydrolase 1